jgi:hypothetical protein
MLSALFLFLTAFGQVDKPIPVRTDVGSDVQYVGVVEIDTYSLRLIILKHSWEAMADNDARLVVEAANLASKKGLQLQNLGDFRIDQNGRRNYDEGFTFHKCALDKLKDFISEQMKVKAQSGDTFVVMTIGHGQPNGGLQHIGQRSGILEAISKAADENEQRTLWWQLSCHAAAALPKPNSPLLTVVASSDAAHESPAGGVEGKVVGKVLSALASKDKALDSDGNGVVTAGELKAFIDAMQARVGRTVFAQSLEQPVFGFDPLAWKIPVLDRNGTARRYPHNYIPLPTKRLN